MPLDIKEKDRIKGSTCCAFDLQSGPAAPWQASWHLTPRWEGRTRQRKDDQSHSDPPETPGLSGWMYESSWGVLVGEQPPFLYLVCRKKPPNERHATVEVGCQAFAGKTKVMNICSHLWTHLAISLEPRSSYGSNMEPAMEYGIGGRSVGTSSEAKPSLTHSRDSWEIHPTSKQTDVRMRVQSSSILTVSQRSAHMWDVERHDVLKHLHRHAEIRH